MHRTCCFMQINMLFYLIEEIMCSDLTSEVTKLTYKLQETKATILAKLINQNSVYPKGFAM